MKLDMLNTQWDSREISKSRAFRGFISLFWFKNTYIKQFYKPCSRHHILSNEIYVKMCHKTDIPSAYSLSCQGFWKMEHLHIRVGLGRDIQIPKKCTWGSNKIPLPLSIYHPLQYFHKFIVKKEGFKVCKR